MFHFATKVIAIFCFFAVQVGHATVEMSLSVPDEAKTIGQALPEISFFNEENKKVSLSSATENSPILLVPFYAHCKSTCPLNVAHLKDVLKNSTGQGYQVVLFSFNPDDTAEDFKNFRRALEVPVSWTILRASPKDTNLLLETLDFRYMTQGADFVHSNTIVVLSPTLRIVKYIRGLGYTARSIEDSVREARRFKKEVRSSVPLIVFAILALVLADLSYLARQKVKLKWKRP